MKILVSIEIDVDFDTDGHVVDEFNNEAISQSVEGIILNGVGDDDLADSISDASGWAVSELSVGIKKIEVEV